MNLLYNFDRTTLKQKQNNKRILNYYSYNIIKFRKKKNKKNLILFGIPRHSRYSPCEMIIISHYSSLIYKFSH